MISEAEFREQVRRCLDGWVKTWAASIKSEASRNRFVVGQGRLLVGHTAWWDNKSYDQWKWVPSQREIDLFVGLKVTLEDKEHIVPLVAIELKTGRNNTDDFDKKSAIYGSFRDIYPFVKTVLMVFDYEGRGYAQLHRNGREFDYILSGWTNNRKGQTAKVLEGIVKSQLDYFIYWESDD